MSRDPLKPERCAVLLSALAAPERLKIIRALAEGPLTVTQIIEKLGIRPVNVSHHLYTLKHAGLIRDKKAGRFVHYSLKPGVLVEAVRAGVPEEALDLGCCRIVFPVSGGTAAQEQCTDETE
jgi:DNA-binding transcriptional ArsR family regulator